jgi:hypothetical protein
MIAVNHHNKPYPFDQSETPLLTGEFFFLQDYYGSMSKSQSIEGSRK